MVHAQKKGKRGEIEFCEWLDKNLYNEKTSNRNYNQADGHSSDVITADFLFEVKRQENLALDDWWYQVSVANANTPGGLIPVVAFRQNRKKWQFLIPAKLIGIKLGYMLVKEEIFIEYARGIVNFNPDLTEEEQLQYEQCYNKDEIRSRFKTMGNGKAYLSDKYKLPFKVISAIVGDL